MTVARASACGLNFPRAHTTLAVGRRSTLECSPEPTSPDPAKPWSRIPLFLNIVATRQRPRGRASSVDRCDTSLSGGRVPGLRR
jgi:hypothetical protein